MQQSLPFKGEISFDDAVFLIQLSQHIPVSFKHYRIKFGTLIVNHVSKAMYTELRVQNLLDEADSMPNLTKVLCGKPSKNVLWDVSGLLLSIIV